MRYFGLFVWLLITVLSVGWLQFHHPELLNWQPNSFPQFVLYIFGGLGWFFGLIAFEVYLS
jgi:hypothetical protein